MSAGDYVGLEPTSAMARRLDVTPRCMLRRLRRLDARLRKECPAEPPVLVRLGGTGEGKGARWFADRAVLFRHARGLVVSTPTSDPWRDAFDAIESLRADLARLEALVEGIATMVAAPRRRATAV